MWGPDYPTHVEVLIRPSLTCPRSQPPAQLRHPITTRQFSKEDYQPKFTLQEIVLKSNSSALSARKTYREFGSTMVQSHTLCGMDARTGHMAIFLCFRWSIA